MGSETCIRVTTPEEKSVLTSKYFIYWNRAVKKNPGAKFGPLWRFAPRLFRLGVHPLVSDSDSAL